MMVLNRMFASIIVVICVHNSNSIEVKIDNLGTLVGSTSKTSWTSKVIYQFLGVRYAEPPSGTRRFKSPTRAVPWPGVHNVKNYGRPCPALRHIQNTSGKNDYGDMEDCLHLSIYTKNLTASQPVMVFIYGETFKDGTTYQYPSNYLLEKDIVLIVPQYRTGPFGFLSTQTDAIPGNMALEDIISALNWTKSFIQNFGGNSKQITIFGHSSGAAFVSALLMSPTVPMGLFHRAIVQSGSILSNNLFDFNPVRNARDIAKMVCNNTVTIEDVNKCFMKMDVVHLLQSYHKHYHKSNNYGSLQEFGGAKLTYSKILPLPPYDLINRKRNIKNIPVMAGVTKHDGSFIFAMVLQYLSKNFGSKFDQIYKDYDFDTILELLGVKDSTGTMSGFIANTLLTPDEIINGNITHSMDALIDLCGTVVLKAPILRLVQAQAKVNPNQTYLYSYDYKGEFNYLHNKSIFAHYNGVHHYSDIISLFPFTDFAPKLNADDKIMAKKMVNLWTSFAATGIPVADDFPPWPPFTKIIGPYMHINAVGKIGTNFLDEFTVATHEARASSCRKAKLNVLVFAMIIALGLLMYL